MSAQTQTVAENGKEQPELSKKRETDWLKVLFQIQVNLSALGALHFLLKDSYWFTVIYGEFLSKNLSDVKRFHIFYKSISYFNFQIFPNIQGDFFTRNDVNMNFFVASPV